MERRTLPSIAALVKRVRSGSSNGGGGGGHNALNEGNTLSRASSESSLSTQSRVSRASLVSSRSQSMLTRGANQLMHKKAAAKFMQLSTTYRTRKELQAQDHIRLAPWIIHPHDILAQCWWLIIIAAVLATAWGEPYGLAFGQYPGPYPPTSADTLLTIIGCSLFGADMLLNFFVAYYSSSTGELIVDMPSIARHYVMSGRLFLDLMTTLPYDWIVLSALGLQQSDSTEARYISLLRLLRLGRMYRLRKWAVFLTNNIKLSLMWVTLVRNALMVYFIVHLGACLFYYIAKQSGFDELSWVGANATWLEGAGTFDQYIYSIYWAMVTFATVGYGDLRAYSVAEAVFVFCYIFLNIFVGAYVIGTITLLVTKQDEQTGEFRDNMAAVDAYTATHNIPPYLKSAMKGHLRLEFSTKEGEDEQVLSHFPSAIRRRILRHLYYDTLTNCWLFSGTKIKFLDAVLAEAKVELFMPNVEVITMGDHVNELHILVAGTAEAERAIAGSARAAHESEPHVVLDLDLNSVHGGCAMELSSGDCLGEMAFFTETPAMQAVRTTSVCRVLSLSRTTYLGLASTFPMSAKALLDNLMERAEELVMMEFHSGDAAEHAIKEVDSVAGLSYKFCSPELGQGFDPEGSGPLPTLGNGGTDTSGAQPDQRAQRVKTDDHGLTSRPSRGTDKGQLPTLGEGVEPSGNSMQSQASNSAEEAGRQGVLGTSGTGTGMPTSRSSRSVFQATGMPLLARQQQALATLLRVKTLVAAQRDRLHRERITEFLAAAAAGNTERLKLMLQQSFNPDSQDYDGRSALMLAAGKGQMEACRMLLEAGANPNLQDEIGGSVMLEVCTKGHDDVLELVLAWGGRLRMPPVVTAAHLCACVYEGDTAKLRRLLVAGANPDAGDYDKRTALHIAACDANLPAVKVLVEEGKASLIAQDRWDATPLDEARRSGAFAVVEYLEQRCPPAETAASLRRFSDMRSEQFLRACSHGHVATVRFMLARGCPPDTADYDQRTGLMLAVHQGHKDVMQTLLEAGANPSARDGMGGNALMEAVKCGQDDMIEPLLRAGARLNMEDSKLATYMCELVVANDLTQLQRLIKAGADINAGDYDKRRPLHIAVAEGNVAAVRMLVEDAKAQVDVEDRWGGTPLAEAKRVQAAACIPLLQRK